MTTQEQPELDRVFKSAGAQVTDEQARSIAAELFSVNGAVRRLTGERDLNFQLSCPDGTHYLLKLSNPAEDPQVVDFQSKALLHILAVDRDLPVPRMYPSRDGHYQVTTTIGDQPVLARLLSFLEGISLNRVANPSAALRTNLASHLARLGLALRGFFHPAAGHTLLWDIKHSMRMFQLVEYLEDKDDRDLVGQYLRNFERHVLPNLLHLRAQVIHNDLNPHNVIVRPDAPENIQAILDFGDMVHAPLINDLAVAASYQLGGIDNPLEPACEFIAAYHRVNPLEAIEQELLFELITARLVMTVAITNWRASLYPENREYILRNAPSAWSGLRGLSHIPREQAQEQIRQACRKDTHS